MNETIFSVKKNVIRKNRANVLLYIVRCLLSIFAQTYSPLGTFVFVEEIVTSTQILQTAYGEKPVRETWRTAGVVPSYRNRCFLKVVDTTATSSFDTPYYDFSVVRTLILNKTTYFLTKYIWLGGEVRAL